MMKKKMFQVEITNKMSHFPELTIRIRRNILLRSCSYDYDDDSFLEKFKYFPLLKIFHAYN